MKNSARGDSSTGSELKAVEEARREASRTVEPCVLSVSVVKSRASLVVADSRRLRFSRSQSEMRFAGALLAVQTERF